MIRPAFLGFFVIFLCSVLFIVSFKGIDIPLLSSRAEARLDFLAASVPFLPKSNPQILTKAFFETKKLQQFKQNLKVELIDKGKKTSTLQLEGSVDKKNRGQINFEYRATLKQDSTAFFDIDLKKTQGLFFFKINEGREFGGYQISLLGGDWYGLDLEKSKEEYEIKTLGNAEIEKDVSTRIEALLHGTKNDLKNAFLRKKDETLEGRDHFSFEWDLNASQTEKVFGSEPLKGPLKLSLLVDKQTFQVKKVSVSLLDVSKSGLQAILLLNRVDNLDLKDPRDIKISSVQELSRKLSHPDFSEKELEYEVANEIVFYERLLHVLTLLIGN